MQQYRANKNSEEKIRLAHKKKSKQSVIMGWMQTGETISIFVPSKPKSIRIIWTRWLNLKKCKTDV